jgi:hypothetical protein
LYDNAGHSTISCPLSDQKLRKDTVLINVMRGYGEPRNEETERSRALWLRFFKTLPEKIHRPHHELFFLCWQRVPYALR